MNEVMAMFREDDVLYINMDNVIAVRVPKDHSRVTVMFVGGTDMTVSTSYDDVEEIDCYMKSKKYITI